MSYIIRLFNRIFRNFNNNKYADCYLDGCNNQYRGKL